MNNMYNMDKDMNNLLRNHIKITKVHNFQYNFTSFLNQNEKDLAFQANKSINSIKFC